ncbi:MAG: HlyD family efflux transporter periplasmic adaptor subunit [Pedosphaera sp.]|nr:HlyD family efflux transporter periplasmic adaptor subunit [Pedosphaera sp.]
MSQHESIPTPPMNRLRDLSIRFLPFAFFGVVLIFVAVLWSQRFGTATVSAEVDTIKVRLTAPGAGVLAQMSARDLTEVAQGQVLGQIFLAGANAAIDIKAPMKGTVSIVNLQPGEFVQPGQHLLTISAAKADRIIAFIRQPLSVAVEPNTEVRIRCRSLGQKTALARVTKVGTELAPIRKSLLPAQHDRDEAGLPVFISVPENLSLHPGEIVDVTFLRTKASPEIPPATNAPATNAPPKK